MTRKTIKVTDMSCVVCAGNVENTVRGLKGVTQASVNFAAETLTVEFDPKVISIHDIHQAVRDAGYDLILPEEGNNAETDDKRHYTSLKKSLLVAWIAAVPVMVLSMTSFADTAAGKWTLALITTVALAFSGRDFYVKAWKMARNRTAGMDTLVALSTSTAWLFSLVLTIFPEFSRLHSIDNFVYFDSAAMIVAFVLTGKVLEEKARSSTTSAIRNLIGLQPQSATVIEDDGTERLADISEIKTGERVLIRPGNRIPVDGIVRKGSSYVDESMLTGEPLHAAKTENDKVFAGTINKNGALTVEVTADVKETLLARIVEAVRDAQGSKAPVQRLADVISKYFAFFIIAVAVLTFAGWLIAGGEGSLTHAIVCAVSVLVIACPCALGLATPTAITVGIGKAAEHHILIKDAAAFEKLFKTSAVVLDKTGTVTEGKPIVVSNRISPDITDADLSVFMAAEMKSEHPLASVIVETLRNRDVTPVEIKNFSAITGKGVSADYKGAHYWVGGDLLLKEIGAVNTLPKENGGTTIYMGRGKDVLALFILADMVKESSPMAIDSLKRLGMKVYMLTGDNAEPAKRVAKEVKVTDYRANMLPDDKDRFIMDLQAEGAIVAMAGDGINDSQALARADVSIAMGSGTDIAIETAMITLTTSDLRQLPKAIRLSRKTFYIIRENLFWAFIYNIIGVPIAAGVLFPVFGVTLDPMWASAAMAISSITVVLNSLRLKLLKL